MPLTQTVEPMTVASHLQSLWARDGVFIEFKADLIQLRAPFVFSRNSRYDLCHSQSGFAVWFRSACGARSNSSLRMIGGGLRRFVRITCIFWGVLQQPGKPFSIFGVEQIPPVPFPVAPYPVVPSCSGKMS